MKDIKIVSKFGNTYYVNYKEVGWTYADVVIKKLVKKKNFLFGYRDEYVIVWEKGLPIEIGDYEIWEVETMSPEKMKAWFQRAVDFYDEWQIKWDEFNNAM